MLANFPGDRLVSVNGESAVGKTYAEVVQLIQKSKERLSLVVVSKQDDILQRVIDMNLGQVKLTSVTSIPSSLTAVVSFQFFSEIAENPESNQSHRQQQEHFRLQQQQEHQNQQQQHFRLRQQRRQVLPKPSWPLSLRSTNNVPPAGMNRSGQNQRLGSSLSSPDSSRMLATASPGGALDERAMGRLKQQQQHLPLKKKPHKLCEDVAATGTGRPGSSSSSPFSRLSPLAAAVKVNDDDDEVDDDEEDHHHHVYAVPARIRAASSDDSGKRSIGSLGSLYSVVSSSGCVAAAAGVVDGSQVPGISPSAENDAVLSKIKKDCELKEEFLRRANVPSYVPTASPVVGRGDAGQGTAARPRPRAIEVPSTSSTHSSAPRENNNLEAFSPTTGGHGQFLPPASFSSRSPAPPDCSPHDEDHLPRSAGSLQPPGRKRVLLAHSIPVHTVRNILKICRSNRGVSLIIEAIN